MTETAVEVIPGRRLVLQRLAAGSWPASLVYGVCHCPFADYCLLVFAGNTLVQLDFPDKKQLPALLAQLPGRYAGSLLCRDDQAAAALWGRLLDGPPADYSVAVVATDFQYAVWQRMLGIACGEWRSYSWLAAESGRPKAWRAVGTAVGKNPVALLLPCHRVRASDGGAGGYHWGLLCKQKLLEWEQGLITTR